MSDERDAAVDAAVVEMALDPETPIHLRLGALKAAQAARPPMPEPPVDPHDLAALIQKLLPEPEEAASLLPDPMRDFDCHLLLGRDADALFLRWVRWIPPGTTRRQLEVAEKIMLRAAREAGVTTGPYELPGRTGRRRVREPATGRDDRAN